ncbi:putative NAD-dependent epimerase/dehydratase [Calothrix parasitica NIES-267]|uniref:Putative NAD-dependent epimerase/dehydratase n=1 Tax=Calothrix parasitica NIES-267 TaxID=1973488 RepID=A0A1Z4LL87_9CYAN|nr:putative NAD-dependent epimerase/dehydratase [Calothrix parasitica NIES-267]
MKILIIGGTNFIGPSVVHQLVIMGHDVTVFHRGKTKADLPENVHHIFGERSQIRDYKSEFENLSPDVVVDMICYTESEARMLMDVFKGITQRVVAISSMDVYRAYSILLGKESGVEEVPLTEDSALRSSLYPFKDLPIRLCGKPADYDKILVEKVVMSSELPGTIIRLPMVYGENDPLNRISPYLKRMDDSRDAIIFLDMIAKWKASYGYVENIGYAIALAVTNEKAAGRIYHVAEPETLSEGERVSKIGELAGWKGKVVSLPKEKFPEDWNLPLNSEQNWFLDSTRIRKELGYSEIVPIEEALKRTIDWERHHLSTEMQQLVAPFLLDYATEDAILKR